MTLQMLDIGRTGVLNYQNALGVVSDNIANANTVGYTRKIVQFENVNLDGQKAGVRISEIQRQVDEFLLRDRRIENGELGRIDIVDQFLEQVQTVFGRPGDNDSLGAKTADFAAAWDQLASFPEDGFNRQLVVDLGEDLATDFNRINETLQDLRRRADQEIESNVNEINQILAQIEDLNVDISKVQATASINGSEGDLKDQRDVLIDRLSQLMDITSFTRETGDAVVATLGGEILVDIDAVTLRHDSATTLSSEVIYNPDNPTTAGQRIGGLFIERDDGTQFDITSEIFRGEMKGLIELRDETLTGLQEQIDTFAETVRDTVNRAHNETTAVPPPTTLQGTRSLYSGAAAIAGTNAIYISDSAAGDMFLNTQITITDSDNEVVQSIDLLAALETQIGGAIPAGGRTFTFGEIEGAIDTAFGANVANFDAQGRLSLDATAVANGTGIIVSEPDYSSDNVQSQLEQILRGETAPGSDGRIFFGPDTTATLTVGGASVDVLAALNASATPIGANGTYVTLDQLVTALNGAGGFGAATVQATAGALTPVAAADSLSVSNVFVGDYDPPTTDITLYESRGFGDATTFFNASGTFTITDQAGAVATVPTAATEFNGTESLNDIVTAIDTALGAAGINADARVVQDGTRFRIQIVPTGDNAEKLTFASAPIANSTSIQNVVDRLGFSDLSSTTTQGNGNITHDQAGTANQSGSFSYVFGLNDFYTDTADYSTSFSLEVNSNIIADPSRVGTGQFGNDIINAQGVVAGVAANNPVPGTTLRAGQFAVNNGDNDGALLVAQAFDNPIVFGQNGTLGPSTDTLSEYGAKLIAKAAIDADLVNKDLDFRQAAVDELNARIEEVSGVNIDEEFTNLILYQNAFSASARVIQTGQEILDEIVNLIR